MGQIKLLDKRVADMIAAGEVIDRPAAVARELIENSIDAGASQITVEIRRGGSTYIRVTDNGCGLSPEDVPMAFLRHATSKIGSERDLEDISTLGFRGEALAAIGSVSHVMMMSRPRGQKLGYSYTLSFGEEGDRGEVGCPEGTTVIVRALFANAPAQYKFLKKDAVEGAALREMVEREALAHPEVAFRLIREGKQVFSTPGDDVLENAVYAVLGDDMGAAMIPVRSMGEKAAVTGFITRPTDCIPSRAKQFFFVNGRWVKSKLLAAALENGYQNQKMVGKFPGAVIHLALKYNALDVNRDPAKAEVRFVDEKMVYDQVYYAVVTALGGEDDRPVIHLDPRGYALYESEVNPRPGDRTFIFDSPPVSAAEGAEVAAPDLSPLPREAPGPCGEGATAQEEELSGPVSAPVSGPSRRPAASWDIPVDLPPAVPAGSSPQWEDIALPQEDKGEQTTLLPEAPDPWRVVGEVLHTYIVVEQGEKVFFIDKHAAHERMGFDLLKAQGYRPMSQELIDPVVVRPGPEAAALLLDHAADLEEFGFSIEEFGDAAVVARRVPDYVTPEEAPRLLEELARQYSTTGAADPEAQRDELMHTMACKAAMKGGQRTRPEELQRVAEAVMSGRVTHCPHGRPVAIELTKYQLEREFKRR